MAGGVAAVVVAALLPSPAYAHGGDGHAERMHTEYAAGTTVPLVTSPNMHLVSSNPGSAGISGCFMKSAPLFVVSNLDSVKVYDVGDPARPTLAGVLPSLQFENEAMSCGERRTGSGTSRFVLIGVDLYQASPDDLDHANLRPLDGYEMVLVDVTDPAAPRIRSRAASTTSTHTVTCVADTDCRYVYSAGSGTSFSVFDLTDLDHPVEVDSDPAVPGVQPFESPTAGHKWNFDGAGYGTHTGWGGSGIFDVSDPLAPRLVTTTGAAGRGEDPAYPGWNDFIHHNSFRPNAAAFVPDAEPSLANGNVLLVTEEDYEQTDCSLAGSFQTWWVRRLDGTPDAIVPLDKVELSDLGTFPVPQYAFCSSHWFDFHPSGIVTAGFYGGGTQLIDVRDPRHLSSYGHATWGASEVWDSYWAPVYNRKGVATGRSTNLAYSVDLVRGLDVYGVDLPAGDTATAGPVLPGTTRDPVGWRG
ncbi:hypothetical protein [Nocardioides mesophilus]|uniref:LVIVD repeat-containing protein n=1 Tax=Nocardioides mesophilus TaxID=433659 RepID=A0A7G9RBD6_9ACTN|nr:hypothetical protein [Nocardioides mesophilus]QNN52911.1 hypothetical protein H9L09_21250 [Nocardioides mesophilus]